MTRALTLLACTLAGGCAIQRAPIPNPSGLPPDGLALEYLLDKGCLPYLLGEKTEIQAMRGVRLIHHAPLWSLFDPPGPPFWSGLYPGLSNVVVGGASCSINMNGGNIADYRAATRSVLRRRFGPAVEEDRTAYKVWLPGQIVGCQAGIHYTYYDRRSWPRPFFSVDLNRVSCDRVPRNLTETH